MKRSQSLYVLLALAMSVSACSNGSTSGTTVTPAAPTVTETFPGTVSYLGTDFHPFTVGQGGTVNVTLTAAGPPPTIWMGLGIGTPSTTTCALIQGDTTPTPGATTAQLSGSLSAGTYCVQVYDVGNLLAPITYSVTVAHT